MNPAFICKSAIRSLERRWLRNCTALAVVLAAMQLLNMYAHAIMKSKETLLELHALIPVNGYITSIAGDTEGLNIDEGIIVDLEGSGYISTGIYCKSMLGLVGSLQNMEFNELMNLVHNSPSLVGTNSLPSFAGQPLFTEGYDDLLLESGDPVCIVCDNDPEFYGYSPGDNLLYTAVDLESGANCSISLTIVGTYESPRRPAPVYCSLTVTDTLQTSMGLPPSYSSASFQLQNTGELDRFRVLLSGLGFASQKDRTTCNGQLGFIIDDNQLIKATAAIQSSLSFSTSLFPAILFLLAGLGFIVSYLLVRLRKPEYTLMRSLGASKVTSFSFFFIEQAAICFLGMALSLLITAVVGRSLPPEQLAMVIGYIVFYLGGAGIAILSLTRAKVIDLLSAKE